MVSYYGVRRRAANGPDTQGVRKARPSEAGRAFPPDVKRGSRARGLPNLQAAIRKAFRPSGRTLLKELEVVNRYYRRLAYRRILGRNPARRLLALAAEDLLDKAFRVRPESQPGFNAADFAALGFHECWTCASAEGPENRALIFGHNRNGVCGSPFCVTSLSDGNLEPAGDIAVASDVSDVFTYTTYTYPSGAHRWYSYKMWARNAQGGAAKAGTLRFSAVGAAALYAMPPVPFLTVDPMRQPLGRLTVPQHLPYRLLPEIPLASPWPYGRKGEQPSLSPVYDPLGRSDPLAGPSVEIEVTPGRKPVVRPGQAHEYAPPKPGEREKKGKSKGVTRALMRTTDFLGGTVLEAADYIDAAYDALGKKCKGAKTPQAKALCVVKNYRTIDIDKLAYNIAINEIEDRVLGYLGGLNAKASRKHFSIHRGFQTGGASWRYAPPTISPL